MSNQNNNVKGEAPPPPPPTNILKPTYITEGFTKGSSNKGEKK